MGDEADALDYAEMATFEDDEGFVIPNEEQEYQDRRRLEALSMGIHTQTNGQTIRLKKMTISHLKNTIRYAERTIREKGPSARFWQSALPDFERETKRRKSNGI